MASTSIATRIATSGGAAKGEREEDLAGDATAREVARIERSLAKTLILHCKISDLSLSLTPTPCNPNP